MDLNEALVALQGAFQRVGWVLDDEFGYIFASGFHNATIVAVLPPTEAGLWDAGVGSGLHFKSHDPVSAVRSWLAAQPTAAFYPEAQSGEVVEVRGWVAVAADGEAAAYGTGRKGEAHRGVAISMLSNRTSLRDKDFLVHPFTLRVPVPVEPPVLVGEVVP